MVRGVGATRTVKKTEVEMRDLKYFQKGKLKDRRHMGGGDQVYVCKSSSCSECDNCLSSSEVAEQEQYSNTVPSNGKLIAGCCFAILN